MTTAGLDLGEPDKTSAATGDDTTSVQTDRAQGAFNKSILISGTRCFLTYVALPFLMPIAARLFPINGSELTIGAVIGLTFGSVAILANIYSIRRFWRADHRWKNHVTVLHLCVIGLLSVLLTLDLRTLFS